MRNEESPFLTIARGPPIVNAQVAANRPAQFLQALRDGRDTCRRFRIVCGQRHEHTDASHPLNLLRARRKRPCRRAAEAR
jgi:hypothetical protein